MGTSISNISASSDFASIENEFLPVRPNPSLKFKKLEPSISKSPFNTKHKHHFLLFQMIVCVNIFVKFSQVKPRIPDESILLHPLDWEKGFVEIFLRSASFKVI